MCCESREPASFVEHFGERMCVNCADLRQRRAGDTSPKPAARVGAGVSDGWVGEVRAWCRQAGWLPRLPLWLAVAYLTVRHLADAQYTSVFGAINFGIHELGHVVFAPFGQFLEAAGGTLLQLAAPTAAAVVFLRQRDWFAVTVALAWLGTNGFGIAVYVADARAQALPLLGLGAGEPIHDWNYLLGRLGLLRSDQALAALCRAAGAASMLAAVVGGAWMLVEMARGARRR
ncbi:MAG: zinc ribbon domain-containing protein [Planctomycetota bacterium]